MHSMLNYKFKAANATGHNSIKLNLNMDYLGGKNRKKAKGKKKLPA